MRTWRLWIRGLRGGSLARVGLMPGGLMVGRVGRGIWLGVLVSDVLRLCWWGWTRRERERGGGEDGLLLTGVLQGWEGLSR
jgi:hypothetical protein